MRRTLFLSALLLVSAGHSAPALAWGCVAEAEDGASGWSERYSTRQAALKRALQECAANAADEDTCEITDCNQDW